MLKNYNFEQIEIAPDIEECLENAKLELSKKTDDIKRKEITCHCVV